MPTVLGALAPQHLLELLGVIGVLLILFAETGLLVGVILPGDSLLFVAGYATVQGNSLPGDLDFPLGWLLVAAAAGAIIGAQVGFWLGRRAGPALFSRPDSRLFRRDYVDKTAAVLEQFGTGRAIVLARFVPIVRTFAPIVAGVSGMEYKTFVRFNVVGGLVWSIGVTMLGYFLGQVDWIESNLEITILVVVGFSFLPIAWELWKARGERQADDPVTEAIVSTIEDD
jgi:membrane-associated protein